MTKIEEFLNELASQENVSTETLTKINDCKEELASSSKVLEEKEKEISDLKDLVVKTIKNGGSSTPPNNDLGENENAPKTIIEAIEHVRTK